MVQERQEAAAVAALSARSAQIQKLSFVILKTKHFQILRTFCCTKCLYKQCVCMKILQQRCRRGAGGWLRRSNATGGCGRGSTACVSDLKLCFGGRGVSEFAV